MSPQTKIGARPTSPPEQTKDDKPAKGGKRKSTLILGVGIMLAVLAAYWFLMGPGAGGAADAAADPSAEPTYDLGEVLVVDSISVNLSGGHYLRLGLGLQLTKDAGGHGGAFDTAKALDAAIALYSGKTQEELADNATREALKAELTETLKELYEDEVVGVYYTDFVTQ